MLEEQPLPSFESFKVSLRRRRTMLPKLDRPLHIHGSIRCQCATLGRRYVIEFSETRCWCQCASLVVQFSVPEWIFRQAYDDGAVAPSTRNIKLKTIRKFFLIFHLQMVCQVFNFFGRFPHFGRTLFLHEVLEQFTSVWRPVCCKTDTGLDGMV